MAAAVLLLWCHGLDASFHAGAMAGAPHAINASDTTLAPTAPLHPELPEVSCCFGGTGSNLLAASLTQAPALSAPLLAALLSPLLLLAARRRVRPDSQRRAPRRTSLVDQAVLIRI